MRRAYNIPIDKNEALLRLESGEVIRCHDILLLKNEGNSYFTGRLGGRWDRLNTDASLYLDGYSDTDAFNIAYYQKYTTPNGSVEAQLRGFNNINEVLYYLSAGKSIIINNTLYRIIDNKLMFLVNPFSRTSTVVWSASPIRFNEIFSPSTKKAYHY